MEQNDNTISKYDRKRGALKDVALWTKPTTIQSFETLTGKAETFIVTTARYEELGGDYVFIEALDDTGHIRLCLPPRVATSIARQRDSLTTRRRSRAAKQRAANLTDEERAVLRARLAKARKKRGRKETAAK